MGWNLLSIPKSEIHGDSIIWRECLALGPVSEDIGNTKFWNIRREFWDRYKVVSSNIPEYKNPLFRNLKNFGHSLKKISPLV